MYPNLCLITALSHIRRLTAEHNSPMPVIDVAHQHLITARAIHANQVAQGKETFKTLDWSGLVAGPRVAAGLDAFDSQKVGAPSFNAHRRISNSWFISTPML